jgi:sugar (pentulose or hexulose) kinase
MMFIGLDLGTSFIKGAVLDLEARQIRHIHRLPFPRPLPGLPPLHREFDPAAVMAAVRSLLNELLPLAQPCRGILMCSLMHGLVLTDEYGRPCSNLTTWQDQRVVEPHPSGRGTYFDVMLSAIDPEERRVLGNELRAGLPVGLLFWLAEQGQPPKRGLPDRDLFLASLPDFVVANLCNMAPATAPTNAMAHGVLNLETMDWHWDVIRRLRLAGLRWPEVMPEGSVTGTLAVGDRRIPCYAPVGDFQCSLTGALIQPGELSLNISTGSQASMLMPQAGFGDYQTRPFFDGRFLATITHIPAGRPLNALVKLLSELAAAEGVTLDDPWGYIARAAAEAGPTNMRADLAFFNSSCGDHGAFTNIREEELTVGHIFRAAFENMTGNYYAAARRVAVGAGEDWRGLVFSGGLAQKFDVLRELICKRFAVPYRLCPTSEDTMLGLLALALAYTGRTPGVQAAMELLLATYHEKD